MVESAAKWYVQYTFNPTQMKEVQLHLSLLSSHPRTLKTGCLIEVGRLIEVSNTAVKKH